jgi:hypothetical protein
VKARSKFPAPDPAILAIIARARELGYDERRVAGALGVLLAEDEERDSTTALVETTELRLHIRFILRLTLRHRVTNS